jgi:hypothetical protein
VSRDSGDLSVGNELEGVTGSGIFGDADIIEIDLSRSWCEADVLDDCSKFDCVKNFRLFFSTQSDTFCIASSFDVPHPLICPDMLIVTNKLSVSDSRKGSLSCSRKTEEEADISLRADIAAGVKRKVSLLGHEVVHDGEHTFFHLSGILSTQDNHLSLLEVETHCCIVDHIGETFVGIELSGIEDIVISSFAEIFLEFLNSGSDQHVGHEQGVIRAGAHDSDLDSLLGAPSRISINNINNSASIQVTLGQGAEDIKGGALHASVHVSPSDFFLSDGISHDGLRSRGSSKYKVKYPVLFPEKAARAPVDVMQLFLVKGSAG